MANQSNNRLILNEIKRKLEKPIETIKPITRKSVQKSVKSESNLKHPTNAFVQKSEEEYKKLETKIAEDLRKQISKLFFSENFSDTTLIREEYSKRVHSCLLLTKIPKLFSQILNLSLNTNAFNWETQEYSVNIPLEIEESELKVLIEKVYSDMSSEELQKTENDLISKFENNNKQFCSEDIYSKTEEKSEHNIDSNMRSNGQYLSHSEEESEESDSYDNNEDLNRTQSSSNIGLTKINPMVRYGTYEVLSSVIYSDDNNSLKDMKTNKEMDSLEAIDQMANECKQTECKANEGIEGKPSESEETSNKAQNSMFSLFIDINKCSELQTKSEEPKQRTQKGREEKRKEFDFYPLNSTSIIDTNTYKSDSPKQRRTRSSGEPFLMRSADSALPHIPPTLEDIPLLPMSPILHRKATNGHKSDNKIKSLRSQAKSALAKKSGLNGSKVIYRSTTSSDSLGDELTEGMNISVQNTYENDSIDVFNENDCKTDFIYNTNESVVSDEDNENKNDFDLIDSKTMRNMKSCSKLGEDLLKMFVQQINTDITIKVIDREIRAHKCILTSRSGYFESIFRAKSMESDSNCVDLKGFSYNSVYFALCHIYSGCLTLAPKTDLCELVLLSDVLAVQSLKEIVVHELLVNRCHFFHSPCADTCIVNVIKSLKLCSRSGLNDLYNRCLEWIAKYFTKVWSNRAFVSLDSALMDACFTTKANQLTAENVLKTTLECERMLTSMPRAKWSEPVFALLGRLSEECSTLLAANYDQQIISEEFVALGRVDSYSWVKSNVEHCLLAAMNKLSPDVSCKAMIELNKILSLIEDTDRTSGALNDCPFNDQFCQLVSKMQRYCERYMIQNANRVIHCQCWPLLAPEFQRKIKDSAVIVFEFDKPIAPMPKLSSSCQKNQKTNKTSTETSKSVKTNLKDSTSKGAVPKNSPKTIRSNSLVNRSGKTDRKSVTDQHIYDILDSIPFETNSSNKTKTLDNNKRAEKVLNLNMRKSEVRPTKGIRSGHS